MKFTAKQIAQFIHGHVVGDENITVSTFSKIEEGKIGTISFLANSKYINYIYNTECSIVIVDDSLKIKNPEKTTIIYVSNARNCVAKLLQLYENSKPRKVGIDSLSFISPKAKIGKNVYIGAFTYIGDNVTIDDDTQIYPNVSIMDNCTIGKNCIIYPNVSIYHETKICNNVILHSGCVIGADGFGFAPDAESKSYTKIPQIGTVTIEDNVEIGANTCVDRSTMGSTSIRKGVKLDNLVQIAHNTDIGENTVMSAQVGIAGSTKIGEWCMFGGQVGIAGHIKIGNKVFLGAQSGIISNTKDNTSLMGTPAINPRNYFKSQVIFQRLPEMYKEIEKLKKEIEELKNKK